MRITHIARYDKRQHFAHSQKVFDYELYIDEDKLETILLDTLDPASVTANLFRKTDLLVFDLNSPFSHAFISLALRNGIHVLSPLLLQYSADELKGLKATAMETKTMLGWIPNSQIHGVPTAFPAIIDCIRNRNNEQQGNQSILRSLLTDLSILLNPVKSDIRKVKVYWLPIYGKQPAAIKLIIDFCDNTVITYLARISESPTSLKINYISTESDYTTEIKETSNNLTSTQQAINYLAQIQAVEYPVETLMKSRYIYETTMKKIGIQQ